MGVSATTISSDGDDRRVAGFFWLENLASIFWGGLNLVGIRGSARVYRPKTQKSSSTLFFALYHLIFSGKF